MPKKHKLIKTDFKCPECGGVVHITLIGICMSAIDR
jgi:predicted RNA-binding Zn-ribbon protein involved in translation (DUF1610 family)